MHKHRLSRYLVFAAVSLGVLPQIAMAGSFDPNDFIISCFLSDTVSIYGATEFNFKGHLETNINGARGIDFDSDGNVVAVAALVPSVRVFDCDGTLVSSFTNPDLGAPVDIKVGPSGNYFIGTQSAFIEVSPGGDTLRVFDTGDYESVVLLPGNIMWGGSGDAGGFLNTFDRVTGSMTGSIALDNGQIGAESMFFSVSTNTVLIADSQTNQVFERNLDGTFVRVFSASGLGTISSATRGPGDKVYASDLSSNRICIWEPGGTFIQCTALAGCNGPQGLLWTGILALEPEPTIETVPALSTWGTMGLAMVLLSTGALIVGRRGAL